MTPKCEKYIAQSPTIASRLLGGEMMIMSAVDSTFYTLNAVASVVWQAADGCTPLSDIVKRQVCSQFEVDLETAQRDVEQFVEKLSGHGILLVSQQPFLNSSVSPTEAA